MSFSSPEAALLLVSTKNRDLLPSPTTFRFLNGVVNTIDWDQNQSDLSHLTLNMRRVTGSPWIADFRCWTWPEVAILGADRKERGLWGREWGYVCTGSVTILRSTHRLVPRPSRLEIRQWPRLAGMHWEWERAHFPKTAAGDRGYMTYLTHQDMTWPKAC